MDPSNWWVGMQNTALQLLVYGESLKGSGVRTDYPGVHIRQVYEVENPNYLIIDLDIDRGYGFTDHYAVDRRLGGNTAYANVINAAQPYLSWNMGIRVILKYIKTAGLCLFCPT